MRTTYNLYCDESCHLENDHQKAMVLGTTWCPIGDVKIISEEIRNIKQRHGLARDFEIKWVKVSPGKINFYLDILDYFFSIDKLSFRAVVVPDKGKLDHKAFGQNHDEWYYKMYFVLLKYIFQPGDSYRIYIDIKDTQGQRKVEKLHDILSSDICDYDKSIIERIQQVRSHEVEILQITDLLIGALSYIHRGLEGSTAKNNLIKNIKERSGLTLVNTTLPREDKFNILVWGAQRLMK